MEFKHGGDIYRYDVEYDFSVNINPLGMPKASVEAAQNGVLLSSRYPDHRAEELCFAIAERESVLPQNVIVGNGAAELIYALIRAIKPNRALLAVPTFSEYETAVRAEGGDIDYFYLKEENNFRLTEDVISYITDETDIIFICNPNNPTGTVAERDLMEKIVSKCEKTGTYICVDECFLPFLRDEENLTLKKKIHNYPHLIVLRAFTKIYAMAGLRLGYALTSNSDLIEKMHCVIQPWNTSVPAQMAGVAALSEKEGYIEKTQDLIESQKEYLISEMKNGLAEKIYDSKADYIFFKSVKNLKEKLLEQKILIRSCADYVNLSDGYYRIGIKSAEENGELIKRWKKIWQSL